MQWELRSGNHEVGITQWESCSGELAVITSLSCIVAQHTKGTYVDSL